MHPATRVILKPLPPPVGEVVEITHSVNGPVWVKVRWPSGIIRSYLQEKLQVVTEEVKEDG